MSLRRRTLVENIMRDVALDVAAKHHPGEIFCPRCGASEHEAGWGLVGEHDCDGADGSIDEYDGDEEETR